MKLLLNFIILTVLGIIPGSDISTVNRHKDMAEKAFRGENYGEAITHYNILVDSPQQNDEGIMLNLGHAFFLKYKSDIGSTNDENAKEIMGYLTKGMESYSKVAKSNEKGIRASANNQLGLISMNHTKDLKSAVTFFKEALKADPYNENIRYNYELAKKLLKDEEEKKQQEDQKEKDKKEEENEDEKKDEEEDKKENNEKKNEGEKKEDGNDKEKEGEKKDGDKGEEKEEKKGEANKDGGDSDDKDKKGKKSGADGEKEKGSEGTPSYEALKKRLQEINMSKERAKMILEAIKNQETQYFQQMRRYKPKKRNSSKPKW